MPKFSPDGNSPFERKRKRPAAPGDGSRWDELVQPKVEKTRERLEKQAAGFNFSPDQMDAIEAILDDDGPFFLTGEAGSGKTYIINFLRENIPGCVVTATTGAAAQLIRGRTLHSFAGIHPLYGVVKSKVANKRMQECSMLIIDEASMLSIELLRKLHRRCARAKHYPKMVLVGDFLQLPPVDGEKLFDAEEWQYCRILKLTQQHRQRDQEFVQVLNDIRKGDLSERAKKLLASRKVDELPDDCTHLMAYKNAVYVRNMQKLNELDGLLCRSVMEVLPPSTRSKKRKQRVPTPEEIKRCRFEDTLLIKEGARVVLLSNEPQNRWVNGSTGVVLKIRKGEVSVLLDEECSGGKIVCVRRICESILDGDGKEVCRIDQYPIALAWAMTIHKAQGLTMDRVGVDLTGHFETGQTYVALSRCKTKEGLFLVGEITRLLVDPMALQYCV